MITSSRLCMRPVEKTDINERYVSWMNDTEVSQFLETRFVEQTFETVMAYWEAHHGDIDSPWFAICLRESGEHIGNIKLGPINWIHRRGEVSLFIGERREWGKGLATEAIGAISDWAFAELGLHKVTAGAYLENQGSISAFSKAGFSIEGHLKSEVVLDNTRTDVVRLGLVNPAASVIASSP